MTDGKNTKCFPRSKEGLYAIDMKEPTEKIQLLETVEGNMEGYSKTEIERAKQTKQIYHKVGAPGMENFKYLIKGNMVKNCPVVPKDIDNMIGIWGKT